MSFAGLPSDFYDFLRELKDNNNKEWFTENKDRFRTSVQSPLVAFVEAMAPRLKKVSKHFRADPRLNGGSIFRIYRDVRFSSDKSPYKTNAGVHFRHELGKDAHAPGFYVHLAPGEVFFGGGIWMPPAPALLRIREAIRDKGPQWTKASTGEAFLARFGEIGGDALKRPPRGFGADHPRIEDIKRKSFFAMATSTEKATLSAGFCDEVADVMSEALPLMKFLGKALEVPV